MEKTELEGEYTYTHMFLIHKFKLIMKKAF